MKPAALLLLGASTVFGCSVANALTFNWATTGTNATGSGTFSIADATVSDGLFYTISSFAGTYNSTSISGLLSPGTIGGNDNKFQYDSLGSWKLNVSGIAFSAGGSVFNLYCSVCNTNTFAQPDTSDKDNPIGTEFINSATASLTAAAPAPAPLPILGLPAVLFYSRKLKKRIN